MIKRHPHIILLLSFLIITIGQFACAVYLPSMPDMRRSLATDVETIKLTYTWLLAAYGLSMLFYGPLSDNIGRKPVVLIGMCIYLFGCIFTLFANSIELLLAGRVLQGIGLGSAAVSRAITKDIFKDGQFVRASAYISMGIALTPLAAQVLGGYIQHYFAWRGNFVFMLVYGLVVVLLLLFLLPETNTRPKQKFALKQTASDYRTILNSAAYVGLLCCAIIVFSGEMVFNVSAPFLLQTQLGVSSVEYGWLIALLLGGFLAGSFTTSKLVDRITVHQQILLGIVILFFASLMLLILSRWFTIWTLILPMIVYMFGNSMSLISTSAAGILLFPEKAGTAGALQGGAMLFGSGIVSSVVADFKISNQMPLALLLLSFTLLTALFFFFLVWRKQ